MTDVYDTLCDALAVVPADSVSDLSVFHDPAQLSQASQSDILAASLSALLDCMLTTEQPIQPVNRQLIDTYIVEIDETLSQVLNAILHHPDFQALEANWRGLEHLLQHAPIHQNIKVDLLNVNKAQLQQDFELAADVTYSGLYEQVYKQEYDTPGGEPYAAIIAAYEINQSAEDLQLLRDVSHIAALAQCPFIAAVSEQFFQKPDFESVVQMVEIGDYLERSEYIAWQQFRKTDAAKYIGLTLPKFMLRYPHRSLRGSGIPYTETCLTHGDYLWGNAAFAFGANILKSFTESGWAVQIRGPESGGKVTQLPMHQFDMGRGLQTKIPTETIIPESRELELAELGFVPLSYYKNSDFACFFSANSLQQPTVYLEEIDTATSRINAKLPYVFLSSRIAHYLKVLQRENIGAAKSPAMLEQELNKWLQTLVTTMPNPSADLIATHPLSEARVVVKDSPDNPGFYQVALHISPHFQIEGINVLLSLVANMPGES